MDNSLSCNTSKILETIQNHLTNGDKESFAKELKDCGYEDDDDIYLQTVELIEKIQEVGVSYFLILVQHPSISSNESRCLLTWCSNDVLRRFGKLWNEFTEESDKKFEHKSSDEKQKFNQAFLTSYSKSIGRLDSFSETCLRFVDSLDYLAGTDAKSGFFNIDIKETPLFLSCKTRNKKYEISLDIENKYYEQLCSVVDNDVPNNLLKLFFRVFVRKYEELKHQDVPIFEDLKAEDFELKRNGLVSGVSSKIYLEDSSKIEEYHKAANSFLQLKRTENELSYNDLERFLSITQTYAMWAYLTGEKAHFYFKVDEISSVGIYTYSEKEIAYKIRQEINSLIFRYFDLLYGRVFSSKEIEPRRAESILLNSIAKSNSSAETISAEEFLGGINRDEQSPFSVFSDVVSHLRETAKHEGKQLFFNVALGNDEYLRAYFEPLQPRFSKNNNNKSDYSKWSIGFDKASEKSKLENEISRVCSMILGNYSFLQEEDVWLCFSFNRKNVIELRYLAKIKGRITYSINELNGFDYINKFTAISKNLREVFVAKIYKNKKALIGYNGYIRLKRIGEDWVLGNFPKNKHSEIPESESPILTAYREIKSRKIKDSDIEKPETAILFRTMDSISKEDGLGAMFVILKNKKLKNKVKNYIADMTEVIEMVEGWKLSELKNEEYLYKLAIQDGATIIDYGNDKIEGRKLVANTTASDNEYYPQVFDPRLFMLDGKTLLERWQEKDSPYEWTEYGKWYEWGARRMTAAALAYQFKGQVEVFIISSDGEIFYLNGKNVCKLDRNTLKFVS